MKFINSFLLLCLLLTNYNYSQIKEENLSTVPKSTTIKINLLDLPGIKNEKSSWEISYELRILDEESNYYAVKAGKFKADSTEKVGEIIGKGNFTKKELWNKKNLEITQVIPFDEATQEKLRNQPKNPINLATAVLDEKTVKLAKEQERSSQIFLFYGTAIIYDANLKKNIIIPLTWTYRFATYPDAKFEMTLKINPDGTYSAKRVLPQNFQNSIITTTTKQ